MEDLGPKFERATGHKLAITFATLGAIVKRVQDGETADVVIIPQSGDRRLGEGRQGCCGQRDCARPRRHQRGRSQGRPQARHLVARSVEAHAARREVDLLSRSSGRRRERHPFRQGARSLGDRQRDEIEDDLPQPQDPGAVGVWLQTARPRSACTSFQVLIPVAGIDIVGPLPGDLQNTIVFSAAIMGGAKDAEAAKALVDFLRTPESAAVIKAKGMEPAAP